MSDNSTSDDDVRFYPYTPNKTLPLICTGIFAVALVYHLAVSILKGAFAYWWAFCAGMAAEAVGYFFRWQSAKNPMGIKHETPYIIQTLAVLIAPSVFCASLYMAYGRLSHFVGIDFAPIKRVTAVFVCSDIASFLVISAGATMLTSHKSSTAKLGKIVANVGLVIQMLAFGLFFATSIIFFSRTRRAGVPGKGWAGCLYGLWIACVLVLVRSIFRFAEFVTEKTNADGTMGGYLFSHEMLYYAFEPLPVIIATAALALMHPAFFLPRDKREQLEWHDSDAAAEKIGLHGGPSSSEYGAGYGRSMPTAYGRQEQAYERVRLNPQEGGYA